MNESEPDESQRRFDPLDPLGLVGHDLDLTAGGDDPWLAAEPDETAEASPVLLC